MLDSAKKRQDGLAHWDYDKMLAERDKRTAWLESEMSYIRGMIHRDTKTKPRSDSKVLQIGAGPNDVIDHWDANEKHAIDPLANEYKEKFHEFQDKRVNYVKGVGEYLPYKDNYFDIVIIRNALDHVDDPVQTLRETRRVLKPRGVLYIWVYLYRWRASLIYRTINALTKRYEVEPWAFTLSRIKRLLIDGGFTLKYPAVEERPVRKSDRLRFLSGAWIKHVIKKICGFGHSKGFSCVAIVLK